MDDSNLVSEVIMETKVNEPVKNVEEIKKSKESESESKINIKYQKKFTTEKEEAAGTVKAEAFEDPTKKDDKSFDEEKEITISKIESLTIKTPELERMPSLITSDTTSVASKDSANSSVKRNLYTESDAKANEGEIFSVKGIKGRKMSYHRENVTVFPSGCMGVKDDELPTESPRRFLNPLEVKEQESGGYINLIPKRRPVTSPTAATKPSLRNPLTGEGYEDNDFDKYSMHRKRDEKSDKSNAKVPPGGYSSGIW